MYVYGSRTNLQTALLLILVDTMVSTYMYIIFCQIFLSLGQIDYMGAKRRLT